MEVEEDMVNVVQRRRVARPPTAMSSEHNSTLGSVRLFGPSFGNCRHAQTKVEMVEAKPRQAVVSLHLILLLIMAPSTPRLLGLYICTDYEELMKIYSP